MKLGINYKYADQLDPIVSVNSLVYNGDIVGKRLIYNGKKYDMNVELAVDCVGYMRMNNKVVVGDSSVPVDCVGNMYISVDEDNAVECINLRDFIKSVDLHSTYRLHLGIGDTDCSEIDYERMLVLVSNSSGEGIEYSPFPMMDGRLRIQLKEIQMWTTNMIADSKLFAERKGICTSYLYQVTRISAGYFIQCLGQTFDGDGELSDGCEYDFCVFVPEEYFNSSDVCSYIAKNFKQHKCNYVGGSSRKVDKKSIVDTVMGIVKDLPTIWNSAKNVDKDVQNVFVWVKTATSLKYLGFEKTFSKHEMIGTSGEIVYQLKTEDSENRYFLCVGAVGDPTGGFSVDSSTACSSVLEDMGERGTFHSVGYLVV